MKKVSTVVLMLALSASSLLSAEGRPNVQKTHFKDGASSTGWINFDFQDGKRIFIPAKIDGHDTVILLATGLPVPDIDRSFANSLGLPIKQAAAAGGDDKNQGESTPSLQIQIGKLTLPSTRASVVDFAPLAKRIGHPLPVLLGDAAFSNLVVDIDFAHHRIAFRDPADQTRPAGSIEVPLIRAEIEHLVPVSIEGAPPAQFELGLGNSGKCWCISPTMTRTSY
jgi:hypothetical protein